MAAAQETPPSPRKKWWQDRAIVVGGIIGVVATIVVGVVTYYLTAGTVSREYQERIKAARNDVLTAVGRSIGEGVVPNREKIQSVISSVERQYGIKEQDSERPDTVIEDIVARVLANEFLDAKRREELSTQLLAVKDEKAPAPAGTQPGQPPESKNRVPWELAVLTGAITAVTSVFVSWRSVSRAGEYGGYLYERTLFMVVALVLAMLTVIFFLTVSPASEGWLRQLQRH